MTAQSIRLHSLEYRDVRTYIIAALFVVGNVVLPDMSPRARRRPHLVTDILLYSCWSLQIRMARRSHHRAYVAAHQLHDVWYASRSDAPDHHNEEPHPCRNSIMLRS